MRVIENGVPERHIILAHIGFFFNKLLWTSDIKVAQDAIDITGPLMSDNIAELGNDTILCHQSLAEYNRLLGKPPKTVSSLIFTSSTPFLRLTGCSSLLLVSLGVVSPLLPLPPVDILRNHRFCLSTAFSTSDAETDDVAMAPLSPDTDSSLVITSVTPSTPFFALRRFFFTLASLTGYRLTASSAPPLTSYATIVFASQLHFQHQMLKRMM
mmetsp:Transcript_21081/g.31057  ORF Transcript_21081/g.31057 Transcript_21081/m.31057 type:complete len:212 (-) Transcript_21081:44-679(-)